MSNIYDLEGNNTERTAQAAISNTGNLNTRSYRGGNFASPLLGYGYGPSTNRSYGEPTSANCNSGSRSTLYL